jgi:hypothetical protein
MELGSWPQTYSLAHAERHERRRRSGAEQRGNERMEIRNRSHSSGRNRSLR